MKNNGTTNKRILAEKAMRALDAPDETEGTETKKMLPNVQRQQKQIYMKV